MSVGVVEAFVHTQHKGNVFVARRGGYDDLLRAGFEMLSCAARVGECAGTLHNDIHATIAPCKVGGVALGGGAYLLIVNDDTALGRFDITRIFAVSGVVLEQVRVRLRRIRSVDGGDLQLVGVALQDGAQHLSAYTPESVNAHASSHSAETLPSRLYIAYDFTVQLYLSQMGTTIKGAKSAISLHSRHFAPHLCQSHRAEIERAGVELLQVEVRALAPLGVLTGVQPFALADLV